MTNFWYRITRYQPAVLFVCQNIPSAYREAWRKSRRHRLDKKSDGAGPAQGRHVMKMLSHSETSFLHALLNWSADLTSRAKGSVKPNYSADQIAAEVAASGSPSGA
jgi:hypothetical protein